VARHGAVVLRCCCAPGHARRMRSGAAAGAHAAAPPPARTWHKGACGGVVRVVAREVNPLWVAKLVALVCVCVCVTVWAACGCVCGCVGSVGKACARVCLLAPPEQPGTCTSNSRRTRGTLHNAGACSRAALRLTMKFR
jgi:hypothetical protein